MFLFSTTVVIRAGNSSEHRSEQLFRQRLPASDNIGQTVQIGRLICLRFMFTWSTAPVVSYYRLLSSSEASDSIQPKNR